MPRVPVTYSEARTKEITEAAYRVFARRGFAEATMQEIAAEAGLSVGALYQYFDGKEALVVAAGKHVRERHSTMFEQAYAGRGSIEEKIAGTTRTYLASLADPDYLYRFRNLLSLWAEAPRNDRVASALRETVAAARDRMQEPWAQARAERRLRLELDPRHIAYVCGAIREGLAALLLAGIPIDVDEFVRVVDAMLGGLITPEGTSEASRKGGAHDGHEQ